MTTGLFVPMRYITVYRRDDEVAYSTTTAEEADVLAAVLDLTSANSQFNGYDQHQHRAWICDVDTNGKTIHTLRCAGIELSLAIPYVDTRVAPLGVFIPRT